MSFIQVLWYIILSTSQEHSVWRFLKLYYILVDVNKQQLFARGDLNIIIMTWVA